MWGKTVIPNMSLDVVSVIFEFLGTKDMLRASRCCKGWRSVLWKYKKYNARLPRYSVGLNLSYLSWVYKISLPENFPEEGLIYFRHCYEVKLFTATDIGLRNLCAKYTDVNGKYPHIRNISNVRSLSIFYSKDLTGQSFPYLKNIEHLEFRNGARPHINDKDFTHLKNLKSLVYHEQNTREKSKITGEALQYLINLKEIYLFDYDCSGLKYLKNCERVKVNAKIKNGDLDNLELVQYLEICDHKSEIEDVAFRNLKNLKHIHLNCLTNLTDECLMYFQNCVTVFLNFFPLIADEGLKYLSNAQRITISQMDLITDQGLKYLSKVKDISIYHNKNITDEGIFALESVRCISLNGCPNLTPKCLDHLARCDSIHFWMCPNIYPALKSFKKLHPKIQITARDYKI